MTNWEVFLLFVWPCSNVIKDWYTVFCAQQCEQTAIPVWIRTSPSSHLLSVDCAAHTLPQYGYNQVSTHVHTSLRLWEAAGTEKLLFFICNWYLSQTVYSPTANERNIHRQKWLCLKTPQRIWTSNLLHSSNTFVQNYSATVFFLLVLQYVFARSACKDIWHFMYTFGKNCRNLPA